MENKVTHKMPLISDETPHFTAKTIIGEIKFPNDYKGKWMILFSHPVTFPLYIISVS